MDTATLVVTILLAALFTFAASIKLLGVSQSLAVRDHLGVKPLQWRLIGVCELAGVAGVLVGLLSGPLLRSVSYFGGNGAQTPLVTLAIWGATGCLLAIAATASRVNYRAIYERFLSLAGRDRAAVLRPGVLSPVD